MSEQQPPQGNLSDEFRQLGKNLVDAIRAAWDSPERRRLQQELETGMQELGSALRKEANELAQSPTGQRIRADVEDVSQRIKSGEAQQKVREDLLSTLQTLNRELQKVVERNTAPESPPPGNSTAKYPGTGMHEVSPDDAASPAHTEPHQEINPDDVDNPFPPEA
jgi:hypothetical protein